ncbi:hypothetical protein TNCV_3270231 [Trichonephila clavipes]|uniref:Uncharacterized protein n=1 Tax=Trichonephila clavipes TaxID=2585209 RepID=A0A8X6SAX5_TRICX|nr:hypothetical protein TNCV_3270231 [Trichonephila clavipes]
MASLGHPSFPPTDLCQLDEEASPGVRGEVITTSHSKATRGLLAYLTILSHHGQVTRTLPELTSHFPNFPTIPMGVLSQNRLHLHQPLYTARHQNSTTSASSRT